MQESRYGTRSRWTPILLGIPLAVFMLALGGYWTLVSWGVVGDKPESQTPGAVGPILAGFAVALGYVSLRRPKR